MSSLQVRELPYDIYWVLQKKAQAKNHCLAHILFQGYILSRCNEFSRVIFFEKLFFLLGDKIEGKIQEMAPKLVTKS